MYEFDPTLRTLLSQQTVLLLIITHKVAVRMFRVHVGSPGIVRDNSGFEKVFLFKNILLIVSDVAE